MAHIQPELNAEETPFVFRALRENESNRYSNEEGKGIIRPVDCKRHPNASLKKDRITLCGHVKNGARMPKGSAFVSATKDVDVALSWTMETRRQIPTGVDSVAMIDSLAAIRATTAVYDLSTVEKAESHGLVGPTADFATNSKEVVFLITGQISAIPYVRYDPLGEIRALGLRYWHSQQQCLNLDLRFTLRKYCEKWKELNLAIQFAHFDQAWMNERDGTEITRFPIPNNLVVEGRTTLEKWGGWARELRQRCDAVMRKYAFVVDLHQALMDIEMEEKKWKCIEMDEVKEWDALKAAFVAASIPANDNKTPKPATDPTTAPLTSPSVTPTEVDVTAQQMAAPSLN